MARQQGEPAVDAVASNDARRLDLYMALLEAEFGDRFDDAARARIREQLQGVAEVSAAVARFPLRNGDEPGSIFRALPA